MRVSSTLFPSPPWRATFGYYWILWWDTLSQRGTSLRPICRYCMIAGLYFTFPTVLFSLFGSASGKINCVCKHLKSLPLIKPRFILICSVSETKPPSSLLAPVCTVSCSTMETEEPPKQVARHFMHKLKTKHKGQQHYYYSILHHDLFTPSLDISWRSCASN